MDELKEDKMHGCRTGDRIICKCDKHPNCSVSKIGFTVKRLDFKNQRMWMIDDDKSMEVYCANHLNAKIKIIKRAK